MNYDAADTAVVVIDPQVDVLSPAGKNWEVLGASVTENRTVEHLVALLTAAKAGGYGVFVSPHYFYPTDKQWTFGDPLERFMGSVGMFERSGKRAPSCIAGAAAGPITRGKVRKSWASPTASSPSCPSLKPFSTTRRSPSGGALSRFIRTRSRT